MAKNISELRQLNKLTQAELGEKINYSDKAVSKWERGESLPRRFCFKENREYFSGKRRLFVGGHSNDKTETSY